MNKIYLTSDLHFCHNKPFIYEPRGFKSVEEMNEAIIYNFNKTMDWGDTLYILGDCFLNNNEEGIKLMKRLPGEKYIIFGNHDSDTRKALLHEAGFHCLGLASVQKFNGLIFYLCHYPTMTSNHDEHKPLNRRVLSLSGHTHSKEIWDEAGGYNVALDAHDNCPVDLDEIIRAFKSRTA